MSIEASTSAAPPLRSGEASPGCARAHGRLEVHRHDDVHRLQGLRGRLPGVERPRRRSRRIRPARTRRLPTLHSQYWNLIRFNERDFDGGIVWLMRKDQCMHCDEPGCLAACPAPGAIVQYENGIVDVNPDQCIGCKYCETGCPFDVPRFSQTTGKMAKCTLCVDRVSVGLEPACIKACPTGCLHFGTKDDMVALGQTRVAQLKANGFANAALYDPQRRRRHERGHGPRARRSPGVVRPARGSARAVGREALEEGAPAARRPRDLRRRGRRLRALHEVRAQGGQGLVVGSGRERCRAPEPRTERNDEHRRSPRPDGLRDRRGPGPRRRRRRLRDRPAPPLLAAGPLDRRPHVRRRHADRDADLDARLRLDGAPLRRAERLPRRSIPGPGSRSSSRRSSSSSSGSPTCASSPGRRTGSDRASSRYMRYEDDDPRTGKYNGGQKLYFWAVSLGAVGLLLSGLLMWFPSGFPRPVMRARVPDPRLHLHLLRGVARVPHLPRHRRGAGDVRLDDAGNGHARLGATPSPALVPRGHGRRAPPPRT